MPGLNAAFVDVGSEKDAFLHYLDLGPQFLSLQKFVKTALQKKGKTPTLLRTKNDPDIDKNGKITDVLVPGQLIMVQIVKEPNKILHHRLKEVKEITPEIKELISDMRKMIIEAHGVGLAASQVGKDLQVFLIDKILADENKVPDVLINPEITEYSKDMGEMEEGCLSLPDYWRQIKRAKKIKIKALDENGKKIKIKARGFLARVFQHEYDHLQGTLIKDRAEK